MKPQKPEHSARAEETLANPLASAFALPMMGLMERGASVFGKSIRAFQQEGVKFMTRRFDDGIKAAGTFGACRTLPDLFAAQQQWVSDTTQAYSDEWKRCSEIMTEVLEDLSDDDGAARTERAKH